MSFWGFYNQKRYTKTKVENDFYRLIYFCICNSRYNIYILPSKLKPIRWQILLLFVLLYFTFPFNADQESFQEGWSSVNESLVDVMASDPHKTLNFIDTADLQPPGAFSVSNFGNCQLVITGIDRQDHVHLGWCTGHSHSHRLLSVWHWHWQWQWLIQWLTGITLSLHCSCC